MLFFFFSWITIVVSTASHEARIHQPTRIRKLTASWNAAQHRPTRRHQPLADPPPGRAHSFLTNTHAIEWKGLPKTPCTAAQKPQALTRKHRINRDQKTMIPLQTCKALRASADHVTAEYRISALIVSARPCARINSIAGLRRWRGGAATIRLGTGLVR
jgi:hypothetical protein